MRQQHQKSRSRGRGRKPQNPMSRNYESNGPDVKIRGNPGHIAEKYSTLARDALSNGDTVMAENYFQHAEHYNRIVAAAQAQKAEEQAANGRGPQPDVDGSEDDDNGDDQNGAVKASNQSRDDNDDNAQSDAKPQKSGRGRRPRKPVETDLEQGAEKVDEQQPPARKRNGSANKDKAAEEQPAVPVEAISEDAAKLPGSITGNLVGEES